DGFDKGCTTEPFNSVAAERFAPAQAVGREFDSLTLVHFEAEAELVVLAFEASERASVVDLPAIDLAAIHWKPLHAQPVFADELLVLERCLFRIGRVLRSVG